jgi:hypothetical protein
MARNPDPKPGRWILPLVVLGMVFFTWVFVQRLEPDVIEDDQPISTTTTTTDTGDGDGGDGDNGDGSEETTPTTLPADLQTFMDQLLGDQEELAVIAVEMDEVNAAWDNDSAGYGETEQALIELRDDTAAWRDSVAIHLPPTGYPEVADAYQDALTAAEGIADAAEDVLAGLRASDTGQARRAALLDFRSGVEAFDQAVADAESAASGSAG